MTPPAHPPARPKAQPGAGLRRAALTATTLAVLAGCGAAPGGRDHRNPNADWPQLTGLPPQAVAGVSQTERGGLVLVETGSVTNAQAAAVATHLCAASNRRAAAPGVMQPVAGHRKIRKIVVTCQR
ncbi:hypothetical protein ACEYYA_14585 [Paracoccus sp. p3-h83]|uniref:hypothetical protein n=1 Tax=Paracoccus sp. p3-h83 TaxID=3342805 RepID=UPI0035B9A5B2